MKDIHPFQLEILQKLLYSDGLPYSKLKPRDMEGSKFTFHLEQLINSKFILKLVRKYHLSDTGKELANRMDLGDDKVQTQAKVSVIMVCKRRVGNKISLLLYSRLKSPFYGYQGFPTGKVKKGEDILVAARRELKEETNLVGEPELFSIQHYKIYDEEKILLEDRIFFVCRFVNPKGDLKSGIEGDYAWVEKSKIWNFLKKPVKEIEGIIKIMDSSKLSFVEKSYTTKGF